MPNQPEQRGGQVARRRLGRLAWLAVGLSLAAFAVFEIVVHDLGPLPALFPAVAPDLAVVPAVVGIRRGVEAWRLAHRLALPLVVSTCSLLALLAVRVLIADPDAFEAARRVPLITYTAGITWLAHLALDRALGVTEPAALR